MKTLFKVLIIIHLFVTIVMWFFSDEIIITVNDEKFYNVINTYGNYKIPKPNIIIACSYAGLTKIANVIIITIGESSKIVQWKLSIENPICDYINNNGNLKIYIIGYNLIIVTTVLIIFGRKKVLENKNKLS